MFRRIMPVNEISVIVDSVLQILSDSFANLLSKEKIKTFTHSLLIFQQAHNEAFLHLFESKQLPEPEWIILLDFQFFIRKLQILVTTGQGEEEFLYKTFLIDHWNFLTKLKCTYAKLSKPIVSVYWIIALACSPNDPYRALIPTLLATQDPDDIWDDLQCYSPDEIQMTADGQYAIPIKEICKMVYQKFHMPQGDPIHERMKMIRYSKNTPAVRHLSDEEIEWMMLNHAQETFDYYLEECQLVKTTSIGFALKNLIQGLWNGSVAVNGTDNEASGSAHQAIIDFIDFMKTLNITKQAHLLTLESKQGSRFTLGYILNILTHNRLVFLLGYDHHIPLASSDEETCVQVNSNTLNRILNNARYKEFFGLCNPVLDVAQYKLEECLGIKINPPWNFVPKKKEAFTPIKNTDSNLYQNLLITADIVSADLMFFLSHQALIQNLIANAINNKNFTALDPIFEKINFSMLTNKEKEELFALMLKCKNVMLLNFIIFNNSCANEKLIFFYQWSSLESCPMLQKFFFNTQTIDLLKNMFNTDQIEELVFPFSKLLKYLNKKEIKLTSIDKYQFLQILIKYKKYNLTLLLFLTNLVPIELFNWDNNLQLLKSWIHHFINNTQLINSYRFMVMQIVEYQFWNLIKPVHEILQQPTILLPNYLRRVFSFFLGLSKESEIIKNNFDEYILSAIKNKLITKSILKLFIKAGFDINTQIGHKKETLLMLFAATNSHSCLDYLLKKEANLYLTDWSGLTVLEKVISQESLNVLDYLIHSPIKDKILNAQFLEEKNTALIYAAKKGNIRILAILIDKAGANDSIKNIHGYTALMTAIAHQQFAAARILFNHCYSPVEDEAIKELINWYQIKSKGPYENIYQFFRYTGLLPPFETELHMQLELKIANTLAQNKEQEVIHAQAFPN